jgi:hypothetical protein
MQWRLIAASRHLCGRCLGEAEVEESVFRSRDAVNDKAFQAGWFCSLLI